MTKYPSLRKRWKEMLHALSRSKVTAELRLCYNFVENESIEEAQLKTNMHQIV